MSSRLSARLFFQLLNYFLFFGYSYKHCPHLNMWNIIKFIYLWYLPTSNQMKRNLWFCWYFWLCHFDHVLEVSGQAYFLKQLGILFCTFKILRPKVCCPVYSIKPCFCHQSHLQLGVVFALALSLHCFWSYFSTDLQ